MHCMESYRRRVHIASGKAVCLQLLIDSLAPLDRDRVAIDSLDVRIKYLIAL